MFCSAVTPLRISRAIGVDRVSSPGWIRRRPAPCIARSCGFLRFALVSYNSSKSQPFAASRGNSASM